MKGLGKRWTISLGLLAAFALWTIAVCTVDVLAVGPEGSRVGFARLNSFFHGFTGVHMSLYTLTDWLSLIPVGICAGFGVLGLAQWIRRKSLCAVDRDILALGGFYAAVMGTYILFEGLAVNYRPVLIDGRLEASYPSSTTLLVLCVMATAAMQCRKRIGNSAQRRGVNGTIAAFTAFMVLGRLLSGVHWLTDIIGGALLSAALVALYGAICERVTE